MNLWLAKVSSALCCIVLLCACAAPDSVVNDLPAEMAAGTPAGASASSPQRADPVSENRPSLQMTMALSGAGLFGSEISGDQNGAYYILSNTEDYSARLLYYDYATRQVIFLSDQMVVTNDEENPGWLEDTFGGAVPLAANGKLYVVKYGKSPIPNIGYEGSPSYVLQMEPNAANRKKLAVPQGCLLSYNTGIAADGENLYLLLMDYDANAMQMTDVALCRADFETGKFERLFSFGLEKDANLVGVYSEGMVIQRSWLPAAYANAARREQLPHLHYEICLYSLSENKLIDTGFAWLQGELSLVYGTSEIYFVKSGDPHLYARSLQTGEERILEEDLAGRLSLPEGTSILLTGEVHDGRLVFLVQGEDSARYYSYSLAAGEILPLSLSYEYEGAQIPVSIAAESDRWFLVNSGFTSLRRSATGTDGAFYTFDSMLTKYALMEKADYWNNVPNYIPFDDALLQSAGLS